LLFPYNRSAAIYRCPADKSTVQTIDGGSLPLPKTRSYNLSNAINGHSTSREGILRPPFFQKESEINEPGPSQLFMFIDVHEQQINDSTFGIVPPG
jgi:hypothetical protein